jgi:hypothetical protein
VAMRRRRKPEDEQRDPARAGGLVVGRLKSAALKSAIAALKSKGTTLHVMPD